MQTEKWDILNEDGIPTGMTKIRGNGIFKKGEYHLVVHIWIVSSDGELLIQRRADDKEPMPGEWAATGGAAKAGEDSFTAASRELYEELGIKSDRQTLKFVSRIKRRNSFVDIWVINADVKLKNLKLQSSEVSEVKWVSPQKLKEMIDSKEYHNYGNEYFSVVLNRITENRGITV